MKLECSIRIEDRLYPQHSMKRTVNCNLYVGILTKTLTRKPSLYLRTASNTYHYQIMNNIHCIQGIKKEADDNGRATIDFLAPKHYLMIKCEYEKLVLLVKLLRKFSNSNIELGNVAIMTELKKPTSTPRSNDAPLKKNSNLPTKFITQFRLEYPLLREATLYLRKLDMKDMKNVQFPVILGRIRLVQVNLSNMGLQNKDLLWLNELPIRTSLKSLCLSKNKITEFPSAVIDCLSLNSLNLDHNSIRYIPHGIHRLQKLSVLQIAHNHLHYLPGDITSLRLQSIDLAFNHLYSYAVQNISNVHCNFRGSLKLDDWAALNVDPSSRFRLTAEDCPTNLLQNLRSLSRCICNRTALRHPSTAYYVPLHTIRFSASSWIHPQSGTSTKGSQYIQLQYHFCTFKNHCVDRTFKREHCFRLVELDP